MPNSSHSHERAGIFYALGAYTIWGLIPIYWKWLQQYPALETISERILWSFLFYWALMIWKEGKPFSWLNLFRNRASAFYVISASILLTANWLIFIWAVNEGHVLEASLGYFINPLINVALGWIFFDERPTRLRTLSIALAAMGVAILILNAGRVPWIALTLGCTFSIYGVMRKRLRTSVFQTVTAETALMAPLALALAIWFRVHSPSSMPPIDWLLFIGSGVITGIPLVWFANAARILPLSSLGFYQYVAPSLQFLLAVFVYKEPFASPQLKAFMFIWAACAVFSYETFKKSQSRPKQQKAA